MAMMEIKTLEVKNSEEDSTIQFWQQFGWNLKSSQRVYNKDSHMESRGDSVYSVTETVDFTKLVLERDKSNPNYSKIVKLEKEYFSTADTLPSHRPVAEKSYSSMEEWATKTKPDVRTKSQKIIFFALVILGAALVALLETFNSVFTTVLQVVGILLIVAAFVLRAKQKKSMINVALNKGNQEAADILLAKFNAYEAKVNSSSEALRRYDEGVERMDAIIKELELLI